MVGEWSQYYRQAALHDLEALHARFIEHRLARVTHMSTASSVWWKQVSRRSLIAARDTSHPPDECLSSILESPTLAKRRPGVAMFTGRCTRGRC